MTFTLTYSLKTLKRIIFLSSFIIFSFLHSFSQPITFEKYYDLGGNYTEEGFCVQQTFDGGYIVAGRQSLSVNTVHVLLQKVDSVGQTQWYKSIGSPNTWSWVYSVKQTADSGYVMTGLHSDINGNYSIYLLKTNINGDTTWTKKYVLTNQNSMMGLDIIQTSDGGYTFTCNVVDSVDTLWTVYLIKTDVNGDSLWTKKYKNDLGISAGFGSLKKTSDGGYIIASFTNPSSNDNSIYLIKTNSTGDTTWTRKIQRPAGYAYLITRGNSIQETTDGGFFLTGTIYNISNVADADISIIKTNSVGDTLWTRKIGGNGEEYGWGGGIQTSDGGYVISGITTTFGNGGQDIYLIKTNGTGIPIWTKTFGGTIDEWPNYIMPTSDNGFIISGIESSWGDGGGVYLIKTDSTGYAPSGVGFIAFVPTEMLIYPNPFSFSATVKIIAPEIKNGTFILYDSFGRIVQHMKVETSQFEIHRENLSAGIYLCAFADSDGKIISQTKIIIQ